MQENRIPDFVGIGAVKAATSWLYNVLKEHPDVWMPPIKELHFFDRKEDASHLKQILFKKRDFLLSRNRWRSSTKKPSSWNLKYFLSSRNLDYYTKLFSPKNGQICGEITPSYALLNENVISQMHQQLPDLKIIYILRNPIERDWSQLCMTVKNAHGLDVANLSDQEVIDFYEDKFHNQSSYVTHIERWESRFDKGQIFIGFFDQIVEDPNSFLQNLFEFLNLSETNFSFDDTVLDKKSNSFSQNLNQNIKHFLVKKEYENIVSINDKYNNIYTKNWLAQAEHL